ncbi:MAG: Holliday junction DNA helicase RuvA [Candidatus Epulonipiscium fishelsonii]|nr:MAG: Holliday junction DNA helicase RuvA [Epulopiscium sp. AS2M-Bin002]
MRILGLDFGSKTTGIALSDPLGITAQGIEIVRRTDEFNLNPTLKRIHELCNQYKVDKIVIGYPKNMNNTLGPRCEQTDKFIKKLEKATNVEVERWDERLTTISAENMLIDANVSRKKRKNVIDKVAAVIILQNYLDTKGI